MARRKSTPLEVVLVVQLLCVTMMASATFSARVSPAVNKGFSYSAPLGYNSGWRTRSNSGSPQQSFESNNYGSSNNLPGTTSMNYFSKKSPTNNGFSTANTPNKKPLSSNLPTLNNQPLAESGVLVVGGGGQWLSEPLEPQGDLFKLGKFSTKPSSTTLLTYESVTKHIKLITSKTSAYETEWSDPLWTKQWYLQDYRTTDMPVMDLNVVPVWRQNINGDGIIVGVMDDGIEEDHPDLIGNYLKSESYDYVNSKPGAQPDEDLNKQDKKLRSHGTMCAGEIAMVAGNNKCGVGIAYKSKIIGIKIVGNVLNDLTEAFGLIHKWGKVDIYSISWGPADDGKTMPKIDRLTDMALTKGTILGRDRKGAVYVVAGGNGRHQHDNCAADYLVNNINMIGIAAATSAGKTTYYSERCTAIFCTAYSSGMAYEDKVVSTDTGHDCTTHFTGTSAAAPLVSGIIALVLQANKLLTYRDVMHIIAMGSEVAPLADNDNTWYRNAKGFWVSNDFGFGLINAENMVDLARKWVEVPKMTSCTVNVTLDSPHHVAVGTVAVISFDTKACQDSPQDKVEYLETVVVTSRILFPYRGALVMYLISPQGTRSQILEVRPEDNNKDGLQDWSIKSVHNWGENPKGKWTIEVRATPLGGRGLSGYVENFSLTFHGTATAPPYHNMPTIPFPRKYSGFRLLDGKTSEDPL